MSDVFQSRWGFHSVDYITYCKLKFIHKCYWQTIKDYASWQRWDRKEPQNRVIRRRKRDEYGNRCGSEVIGPRSEPQVCPHFRISWNGVQSDNFVEDYQNARIPVPKEEVKPLFNSLEKIEEMYRKLKEWFEQK
jgi:hypothetical protein